MELAGAESRTARKRPLDDPRATAADVADDAAVDDGDDGDDGDDDDDDDTDDDEDDDSDDDGSSGDDDDDASDDAGARRAAVATAAGAPGAAAAPAAANSGRARRAAPDVKLYLGPTNSGKTHKALIELAAARQGVYAAPLRLLAWEAHERLRAELGAEMVGLVTGEEQLNPAAPVICCTAECAPMRGRLLVLDECHWLADPERGSAWKRLLVGGEFDSYRLCGAVEAEPLLRRIFAHVAVEHCARRSTLTCKRRPIDLTHAVFKPRADGRVTCLVCFSRAAVHALAARLQRQGARVAVLYGVLPPETRLKQIRAVIAGEVDVVVATDVIGHGVNLPIDRRPRLCRGANGAPARGVRAPGATPDRPRPGAAPRARQGTKYDGTQRRALRNWEGAQIAGRAGRGARPGTVRALGEASMAWDAPSAAQLAAFVALANGEPAALAASDLALEYAPLRPQLRTLVALGGATLYELPAALDRWAADASHVAHDGAHLSRRARRRAPDCIRACDVSRLRERLDVLVQLLDHDREMGYYDDDEAAAEATPTQTDARELLDTPEHPHERTLRQYWALATAPISHDSFEEVVELALVDHLELTQTVAEFEAVEAEEGSTADALEKLARWIDDLWRAEQALRPSHSAAEHAGRVGIERADYEALRAAVVAELDAALAEDLEFGDACQGCGKPKDSLPWHTYCEACLSARRVDYGYDGCEFGGEEDDSEYGMGSEESGGGDDDEEE
jgi:hypothetical protein